MAYLFINEDQRKQLNDIYSRIVKKYTVSATDTVNLSSVKTLSMPEAAQLAGDELDAARTKVLDNYVDQVAKINANAMKRGLQQSTVVISQLDKTLIKKNEALLALDVKQDKLARKIFADNQRLALSVEREKSTGKSRSLRDYIALSRMKLTVPGYNAQTLIDEELYAAYLEWLLDYTPADALNYFQSNILFYHNMGLQKYNVLLAELQRRAGV